jgi:molybdopterin synthase catalytic subunit
LYSHRESANNKNNKVIDVLKRKAPASKNEILLLAGGILKKIKEYEENIEYYIFSLTLY